MKKTAETTTEPKIDTLDADYAITMDDDDEMVALKKAVFSLNPLQRKVWLTYAEIGTIAGTSRVYGVSTPTMRKYLKEIKEKIFENL